VVRGLIALSNLFTLDKKTVSSLDSAGMDIPAQKRSHTRTPQAGEAPVQCSAPRSTHQPTRRGATPSSRSRSIDMRDSERPPRENKQPGRRPRRARQRSHVPTAPVLFFPTRARRRCARRAEPRLVSMASRHAPARAPSSIAVGHCCAATGLEKRGALCGGHVSGGCAVGSCTLVRFFGWLHVRRRQINQQCGVGRKA
jgi:hypothetical protein